MNIPPLIHVYPGGLDMVPGVRKPTRTQGDIASAVLFALEQPERVNVAEIVIRPTMQILYTRSSAGGRTGLS